MDEITDTRAASGGPEGAGHAKLQQSIQGYKARLDTVLTGVGYFSGGMFALLAFFITYDVLARKWGYALGIPTTRVTDEISGYLLVLAATWGMAYTLKTDSHVRIDVLLPYMPAKLRTFMDFLALALMGYFAFIIALKSWLLVIDSIETDIRSPTYLLTPLYIPQTGLAVGFTLLALTAAAMAAFQLMELAVEWNAERGRRQAE